MTHKAGNHIGVSGKPGALHLLQVFRGLAAVSVVCYHASLLLHEKIGSSGYGWLLSWGFSGVHVFFVLSGFIICLMHFDDIGNPLRVKRYLYKRFIRIYPVYWVILLIGSLSFVINENWAAVYFYLENISLIRITSHDKIIPVAWTLSHEILFYLVFMLFIINRHLGMLALSIWIGLICYFLVVGESVMLPYAISRLTGLDYGIFTNFVRLVSLPINLLFAVGAVSYLFYRVLNFHHNKELIGIVGLLIGLLIFAAASSHWLYTWGGDHDAWGGYNAVFGLGAFFFMIGLLSCKADTWAIKQPTLLRFGDASYSIYLVHYGLQQFILDKCSVMADLNVELFFILLVLLAVICGLIFYHVVEAPLLSLFGRGRAAHRCRSLAHHDSV